MDIRHLTIIGLCTLTLGTRAAAQDPDTVVAIVNRFDLEAHGETSAKIRQALDARLLTPSPDLRQQAPKSSKSGVHRILNRGRWDKLTWVRGGGAYFSFSEVSNDYDQHPQLGLHNWSFSSGFYGGCTGAVAALPQVQDLDRINPETDLPAGFHDMTEGGRSAVRGLRQTPAPLAEVGKTFVVRSVLTDRADLLAVFKVLDQDDNGITFSWRILEEVDLRTR